MTEHLHPSTDPATEVEDFDAFWQRHTTGRTQPRARIFGALVPVPMSLPLQVLYERDRLADSEDLGDTRRLVAMVWGEDALDEWSRAGCDMAQFQILLAYGFARASGQVVTFDEIAARVAEATAAKAAAGKAQAPGNRAARRAGGRSRGRTGR
ncbi:hypothetical protein [Longispora albida]|uniref:hypothetical protein n=1 Tax=Longispora albida TaxID=203523 RepID=UPI000375C230|nr:hypothetical protein [Longispora albida]